MVGPEISFHMAEQEVELQANSLYCIEIDEQYFPILLQLFFETYSFYHDRHSRRAVQQCIIAIFTRGAKPEALSNFIKTLHVEAAKPGIAPSNAFVLVEWFGILLQVCAGTSYWLKWGIDIISSDAQVLELCQSTSQRSNLKHSALVVTRRALRKVFSHGDTQEQSIKDAVTKLSAKGSVSLSKNAIMLGVISGVCARKVEAKLIFECLKPDIYAFYTREILGSRTAVSPHIADGLHDFFLDFTTEEDVEKYITPSLEKSLLRAPEIVLDDLVTPLMRALSDKLDLSSILFNRLLKPLLSCIKSSNPAIRQGAIVAFKVTITRCHDEAAIGGIADEILTPLKSGKLPVPDQRALHSEMLAALPVSEPLAKKLLLGLAAVAAKEANEVALSAETTVLSKYIAWGLENSIDIEKSILDIFAKGISDKKIPTRKIWTLRLGEILWATKDDDLPKERPAKIAEAALPALIEVWNEVLSNPLTAAQSGLITAAFVLTSVTPTKLASLQSSKVDSTIKKAQVIQQALTFEPKPSFLLNHRIYSKMSHEIDMLWFIRALEATSGDVTKTNSKDPIANAWAQAIIFCICSNTSSPGVRREAIHTLSRIYVRNPDGISEIIINALWRWTQSVEAGDKDSASAAAKSENAHLHLVVKSICLSQTEAKQLGSEVDTLSREQQMVSMLVISRPELLPRVSWIELCLRVGVDPGDLARKNSDALIDQILTITSFDEKVRPFL